jgi:hypothetical protein
MCCFFAGKPAADGQDECSDGAAVTLGDKKKLSEE